MNVKEFTSRRASKLLEFRGPPSSMATALLVSQAAPEPRSWVGRVRVVGAADVIDALGAWRAPRSRGFHRDSIEAGSFGNRPRTFLRGDTGRPTPALPAGRARSRTPKCARSRARRRLGLDRPSPPLIDVPARRAPWPRPSDQGRSVHAQARARSRAPSFARVARVTKAEAALGRWFARDAGGWTSERLDPGFRGSVRRRLARHARSWRPGRSRVSWPVGRSRSLCRRSR